MNIFEEVKIISLSPGRTMDVESCIAELAYHTVPLAKNSVLYNKSAMKK